MSHTYHVQSTGRSSTSTGLLFLLITFVIGWIVYGGAGGGFWMALLWIALSFTAFVGLVPVVGPFFYWKLATRSVIPLVMGAAGLDASWLTTVILWAGLLASIYWTIISLAAIAIYLGGNQATQPQYRQAPPVVRCNTCGYVGTAQDLINRHCPSCGVWLYPATLFVDEDV